MGFVDLHLHLLPAVDDGCRTMEDTLEMAKGLLALGFTTVAPSPHNRPEYANRAVALQRLEETRTALATAGLALGLEPNAENFFLDEGLLASLSTPESRRIGTAAKYLLVEAPYTSPLPPIKDLVFRIKVKGVTPVIAHPERCMEFERKGRAAELVQSGAVLQLDVGAVIGRYGKDAQKLAREFLDAGLYGIAATDLHSPVGASTWVAESMKALERMVGTPAFKTLLETNPAAILRGEPITGW